MGVKKPLEKLKKKNVSYVLLVGHVVSCRIRLLPIKVF